MSSRITDSPAVRNFRVVLDEYGSVLQQSTSLTAPKLLRRLEVLLPALIHACVELPELHSGRIPYLNGVQKYDFRNPTGSRSPRLNLEILAPYGLTLERFDPYNFDDDGPTTSSLSSDLADVFSDLYCSEEVWEMADAQMRRYIVYHWRTSYSVHWGHHAIQAMGAVYSLLHHHWVEDPDMEVSFISRDVPENASWLEKKNAPQESRCTRR